MLVDATRRLRRLGLAALSGLALAAAALSPAPAQARVFVVAGVPYYVPPPAYYYPVPRVVYRACGIGWHWVPGHWNRWGRWVPPHCNPNW